MRVVQGTHLVIVEVLGGAAVYYTKKGARFVALQEDVHFSSSLLKKGCRWLIFYVYMYDLTASVRRRRGRAKD